MIITHSRHHSNSRSRIACILLVSLLLFTILTKPFVFLKSTSSSPLSSSGLFGQKQIANYSDSLLAFVTSNNSTFTTSSASSNTPDVSESPLFYHASPGTTGSRTLFEAICQAGFPSVHHRQFCISQSKGIGGGNDGLAAVKGDVVDGVRTHFELLRLYQLAGQCCRLHDEGKINNSNKSRQLKKSEGRSLKHTYGEDDTNPSDQLIHLCHTPINEWVQHITNQLTQVLQSGVVGLFDTPYPYLAPQIMELADQLRIAPPIIAMTERDPNSWAKSRSMNHGLMVCKKEYSFGMLGASEFDALGCVERALNVNSADHVKASTDSSDTNANASANTLNFWDVFHYRSNADALDAYFQLGMELQMEHHQQLFLPLANYTPDFFGVKLSHSQPVHPSMEVGDIAVDIAKIILQPETAEHIKKDGIDMINEGDTAKRIHLANENYTTNEVLSTWREIYNKPLTCIGRVTWDVVNDTFFEQYLPKKCRIFSDAKSNEAHISFIPLIET